VTRRRLLAAVPLLLAAALAGCAPAPQSTPDGPASPGADDPVAAAFEQTAAALGVPGAFALVRTPEGERGYAYGTTELGAASPPTEDTRFRIASNTKVFTGTVILQLVDEGRIALDDPISAYRDGIPNGDAITIEMLLAMRSGLADYTDTPEFAAAVDADPTRHWSPEELVALATARPARSAPGTEFHYANVNTVLLGELIEQLEGEPLARVFQERLLDPLGLDGTSYPDGETGIPAPSSHGYLYGDPGAAVADEAPADAGDAGDEAAGAPHDVTTLDPSMAGASGAIVSTARDMADWIEAVVDGGLLSAETQEARDAAFQAIGPGSAYGLALFENQGWIGHNGEIPGFNSFAFRNPGTSTTVVVWSNLLATPDGTPTAGALFGALVDALG